MMHKHEKYSPSRFLYRGAILLVMLHNKKPRFQILDFGFSDFGFQEMGIAVSKFQVSGNGNRDFSPPSWRWLEANARFPHSHCRSGNASVPWHSRAGGLRSALPPAVCAAFCGLLWLLRALLRGVLPAFLLIYARTSSALPAGVYRPSSMLCRIASSRSA